MQPTVYVVSHNGNAHAESFSNDVDAVNYAKLRSRSSFCAIYHSVNNKMFIYENEELCNAARARDLNAQVQEMLVGNMEKEVRQGRKKR